MVPVADSSLVLEEALAERDLGRRRRIVRRARARRSAGRKRALSACRSAGLAASRRRLPADRPPRQRAAAISAKPATAPASAKARPGAHQRVSPAGEKRGEGEDALPARSISTSRCAARCRRSAPTSRRAPGSAASGGMGAGQAALSLASAARMLGERIGVDLLQLGAASPRSCARPPTRSRGCPGTRPAWRSGRPRSTTRIRSSATFSTSAAERAVKPRRGS